MRLRASFDGVWSEEDLDLIADTLVAVEERLPLDNDPAASGPLWTCEHASRESHFVASRQRFPVIVSAATPTELREKLMDLTHAFQERYSRAS